MIKITPDPHSTSSPQADEQLRDALRLVLSRCAPLDGGLPQRPFTVRADLCAEEALCTAHDLLECATVTAYESAENLTGAPRKLVLTVVHLLESALTLVGTVLERQEAASRSG